MASCVHVFSNLILRFWVFFTVPITRTCSHSRVGSRMCGRNLCHQHCKQQWILWIFTAVVWYWVKPFFSRLWLCLQAWILLGGQLRRADNMCWVSFWYGKTHTKLAFACLCWLSRCCRPKLLFFVCPMLCICIGQNIKLRKRPSIVHLSIRSFIRRLWTRMWRYLWTDLHQIWNIASPYVTGVQFLCAVRLEVLYVHACPLTDRHSQLPSVCTNDSHSFQEIKLLLCGLFQQNVWISIRYGIW